MQAARFQMGLPSRWESEPEHKDELECVVEWEPVDSVDKTLKDSEESEDDPVLKARSAQALRHGRETYCEPLCIVALANTEQSFE